MDVQKITVAQIRKAIDETVLTTESSLQDLIDYLLVGKENKCPQCKGAGTINEVNSICPTCNGNGYTSVPKTIDRENSIIIYKDVIQ